MTREFDEAVERARRHLRAATIEGLEAARAVLEAALAAAGTQETPPGSLPGRIRQSLEELAEGLRSGRRITLPSAFVDPLTEALEGEIARWRLRSRDDPDARLVLRAFQGLRELLEEMGIEGETDAGTEADTDANADADSGFDPHAAANTRPRDAGRPATPRRDEPRVQRFRVEN
ncbi:MAG: hypothetical protein JRF61_27095 [Deltaproteobacteria bacterium]|jgi:hypothetical protein|nr:hypothetical protein [Deltaproteobacteria bacterium]